MFSEVFKRFWKEKLAWNVLRIQLRDFKDQEERNIRKLQLLRDYIHTTFMKIVQFSRPPQPPLSTYVQNLSTPWSWTSNFKRTPSPQFQAKPHYLLFHGFILLCVQLSKNITKCLFHLQLLTFVVLIWQSTYFICTTWKRTQTIEKQPHRACERTKSKQKRNQVTSDSNCSI